MKWWTHLLCCWAFLLVGMAKAQTLPEVETVWSKGNVFSVATDDGGYLWVSTSQGIFRYDGYTFHPYLLPDTLNLGINEKQNGIAADTGGWMWLTTREAGIVHFQPATGKWQHYLANPKDSNSPVDNRTTMTWCDPDDRWWFGMHAQGMDRYEPTSGSFTHFQFHKDQFTVQENARLNIINEMIPDVDSPDHYWVATSLGIVHFNHRTGHYKIFPVRDDPDLELENSIQTVYKRPNDSRIWCGTWGGGILALDTTTRKWEQWMYRDIPKLHGGFNVVFSIQPYQDESAWICTIDSGLGLFHFDEKRFEFLEKQILHVASGSPSNCQRLFPGPNNTLWLAANDGLGRVALKNHQFQWHPMPNRLNQGSRYFRLVSGMNKNDSLWLTSVSGDGVYLKEPSGRLSSYSLKENGQAKHFNAGVLFEYGSELWAVWGESPSLYRIDKSEKKAVEVVHELPEMRVNTFHFDGQHSLYLGTRWKGLIRLDLRDLKPTYISDKGLSQDSSIHYSYFDLLPDGNGNLWAGTDHGILVFDSDLQLKQTCNFQTDEVSNARYRNISGLQRDTAGRMWLSSWDGGFGYIHEDSLEQCFLQQRTNLTGWPQKPIKNFLIDDDHWMWVLQNEGLSVIPPAEDTVYTFTEDDGLPLNRIPNGLFKSGKGHIGIGCAYGYAEGKKEDLLVADTTVTRVGINQLKIMGKDQFDGRTFSQTLPIRLDLPYDQNFLNCDLVPLHFAGGRNRISWKLVGLDSDWSDTIGPVALNYAALAPGNYTLLVQASTRNGKVLPPEAVLHLTIRKPFWTTWWFRSLIVALILGTFALIYWIRIRQVKQRQRLQSMFERQLTEMEIRALRAQLNPHFIFNSLNTLKHFLISGKARQGVRFVNKFAGLLRMILSQSQQTETTLGSELEFVELYLNLEQMRSEDSFEWELEVEEGLEPDQLMVPPLLIQPFAENAVWHGLMPKEEHRKLWLRVFRKNQLLCLEVEDNGVGREKAAEFRSQRSHRQASYGTEISRQRLHHLMEEGASYEPLKITDLKSDEGRALGTRVTLVLPIKPLPYAHRSTGRR